jgi:hypothetical protein
MANLTLTIDDDLLAKARQRAAREKTSVNALVRDHLANYARADDEEHARDLIRLMDQIVAEDKPSSGGKKWTREEIYDREVLLRHKHPAVPVRHKRKP